VYAQFVFLLEGLLLGLFCYALGVGEIQLSLILSATIVANVVNVMYAKAATLGV